MDKLLPRIDTYRLLIFYYVCQEKSITAAAEKLFLSQPTVTIHIKTLEKSIQAKLFHIERKKLMLTKLGEGLFEYAREILQQAMQADRYIEISKESSLKIGISSLLVHKAAGAFNAISERRKPDLNLEARSGESFTLFKDLQENSIDLAVVPNFDFPNDSFKHVRVADNVRLVFYAGAGHPVFRKAVTGWSDIFDYPLIIGTKYSPMAKILAKKMKEEGLEKVPKYHLTADNFDLNKIVVKNGNSISFSLMEDIKEEVEKGLLRPIPLPNEIYVDIDIIGRPNIFPISLVEEFVSCIKAAF